MSFSASTCVTNLGGVSSASTVQILTYPGNVPIGGNIILSAMTGSNCPYTITGIPDGTTMLKIFVPSTNACGYIDISDNDLCNTCDLGFDSFTSSTIGNIVVGNLTGSCQNPITDYRILWFGPSESMEVISTNVARISGKGSAFTYNYQHPLTGINSLPMEQGYYRPVIDKVRINGVNFSYTGGTGYVPADLECFNSLPVYVSGYTCENGKETIGNYTHRVNFESTGGSLAPAPLTSTFILSGGTTNFFAWKFKGYGVPDQLKLTFYGSAYGFTPIILEWWEVGDNLFSINSMQNINVFPKSADTNTYISKVTTLTGLTINDNDRILLEVIPSKTNYNTSWDFYFTCLETFTCDTCLDNYENESYKIIGNRVTGITDSCGEIRINIPFSGCDSSFLSSDIYKYTYSDGFFRDSVNDFVTPDTIYISPMGFDRRFCNRTNQNDANWGVCSASGSYISFKKDNSGVGGTGVIQMYFSGTNATNDFNKFYNNYLTMKTNPYSSGSTNNTEYSYYRYLRLGISSAIGATPCGDSTGYYGYPIHHPTADVLTGLTSDVYSLNITMPTITKNIFPDVCDVMCDSYISSIINEINSASTGGTNNRTLITNVGSSYQYPFQTVIRTTLNSSVYTAETRSGYYYINANSLKTVPASGSSNTLIPSLSGQVCDYNSHGFFDSNPVYASNDGTDTFVKILFNYKVVLTNPSDVGDFDIYASPINNFVYSGYPGVEIYELAYSYSGGSVVYSNPTYVI